VIRLLLILTLLAGPLFAGVREEALVLANEAGKLYQTDPSRASQLAGQAYQLLLESEEPAPADLAACAGLAARTARFADETERSLTWFTKALTHADLEEATVLRAELGDLLMRTGDLPAARKALGPPPKLKAPSATLAQWHQTSAKLHLTCGLPAKAKIAIEAARKALPPDDPANQVALIIDEAGIALRLEEPVKPLLEQARVKLRQLESPDPDLLSAFTSIAAQAPGVSDDEAFAILNSLDLESLPKDTRLTYSVTLADAALRNKRKDKAKQVLAPVIKKGVLPDDHPLLARAFALFADASGNAEAARRSSRVALRWLANSDDSEILLGLQRTVDPLSPLVAHAPDELPQTALTSQNFALRKRLEGTVSTPNRQTILYLLHQQGSVRHYGAVVFAGETQWIDLGPAEKIHQRIFDTIETAERTLAEVNTGANLQVRLTQLWKSLWAPLSEKIDPSKPVDIAPVGMLHAVPWATLRRRDGRYLCQTLHEARILALTGMFPKSRTNDEFFTFGIQSAPGSLPDQGSFPFDERLSQVVPKLPALPGVTKELEKLGGISYLNPNREKFLILLQEQPSAIHLAGHGFVIESEEGIGFRAGLILDGGGAKNILFARDIAKLDLSGTQLVVLSACRGGIGRSEVGGNWSSLRRSFIAAGVDQVLAAQWRVRDDQLPDFMAKFHQQRKKHSAPQALWKMQREMLQDADDITLASVGAWVLECVPIELD
jgi:CHAT domain-containing protein